jgi:transposase-like protein
MADWRAMSPNQFTISEEKIQAMLFGERGMEVLTEELFNQLLQAEMTQHLGAAPGEQTKNRRGYRNGSYKRKLTTRVGTLELEVPRDRKGTFKTELFERYQRNEKALVLALMEMVVQGVSTRKVKKITDELCGRRFSRQTVSRLAQKLDGQVQAWAERKLEHHYPFLIVDAMQVKVRRQQAVRSTTVMIAVGISENGYREILGLKVGFSETGEGWRALFSDLKARGLSGVEMLTSDAHDGLRCAAQQSFPGAIWQRCQAHFRRNVADRVPAASKERIHEMLDSILEAPSPADAREALERVTTELQEKAPAALEVLEEGFEDATAALALPEKYRRRLRTTNMVERFIEEIRRREKVVRIFPNMQAAWRLIGALCAEQHEEWAHGRRYLTMEAYVRWKANVGRTDAQQPPNPLPKAA